MLNEWTKRPDAENDDWERNYGVDTYCAITQYAGSDDYCWHARRGYGRLHGLIRGRESAMQQADSIMALPIGEFNERAVATMIDELREIEKNILRLAPDASLLPGYHAGYAAGRADMRCLIKDAMGEEAA